MKRVIIQKDPIDFNKFIDNVASDSDGAVVTFIGRARNSSRGKDVTSLDYEVYDTMARREMEKIMNEAVDRWSLNGCVIVHRYGHVNIGEASIFITVSSPHRDESYRASRYIIDTIKQKVPIWKKENYSDGSSWISETA